MNDVVVTLDVDWAPDFVIDSVASRLIEASVKATWFVTHSSPATARLRARPDLFEIGIHPNFLAGSSHGETPLEVLRHCMKIAPEATTMRTHALVQSGPILETTLSKTPIRADVSLFLPGMAHLRPVFWTRPTGRLVRVPAYWEDNYEMGVPRPNWSLRDQIGSPGLKVINFHPIHVYLNATRGTYAQVKALGHLPDLTPAQLEPLRNAGIGPRSMFDEALQLLSRRDDSQLVRELAAFHV